MKTRAVLAAVLLSSVLIAGCVGVKSTRSVKPEAPPDWAEVEKVFGRKGSVSAHVFKVTFPRFDLKVSIGSVPIDPPLALTSWIALHQAGERSMLMGDLVLLERETEPVTTHLISTGLRVTALHNHLLHEAPRVVYLHIEGEGDPLALARDVVGTLSLTQTPLTSQSVSQPSPAIDWGPVEKVLGRAGERTGRVIQFSIARAEPIVLNGREIPPAMGVAHVINLQAVAQHAATAGDLVLLASEVNPVIRALRKNGIAVTAIHNHMLQESPRLFFLHFWGTGQPERLAQGLRHALDQTSVRD